jgi:hypothetical protein
MSPLNSALDGVKESWDIAPEPMKTHPIDGCVWVRAIAYIRNNATGEVRQYPTDEVLDIGEPLPSVFNWEENNYACDCNRYLFFERAGGREVPFNKIIECGEGKYSVNLANAKDGEIYYREFD